MSNDIDNLLKHDDLKVIGNRIKELRTKLGLTQEELAKRAGYTSRSTINKIEKGLVDITQSKFVLLSKVLGVTPSQLLGWSKIWDNVPDLDIDTAVSINQDINDNNRAQLYLKIDEQVIDVSLDKLTIASVISCLQNSFNSLDKEKN